LFFSPKTFGLILIQTVLHFAYYTIVVSLLDKSLTLAEAEDMGGSLVLVASQEARAKAVLGDKYDPIQVKNIGRNDSVLGIRNRIFLGLLDPDPLVRGTYPNPAPDPSIFS
jgi:hypothetical protein